MDDAKQPAGCEEYDRRYVELMNRTSDSVVVFGRGDGQKGFVLLDFNESAKRLVPWPRHEVLGRRAGEVFPGARSHGLLEALRRVWDTGEPVNRPVSLYKDDRVCLWLSERIYKVSSDEIVVVIEDHTALREKDQEINQLEDLLRAKNRMEALGNLAAGIVHDFNNVLAIMTYNAELALHDELPPDSPACFSVSQILEAAGRARELIRQIASFHRPEESGRRPLRFGPLVQDTLRLFRVTLPSAIRLRFEVGVPEDWILGNSTQLSQVLVNLCTNAVHAMAGKGGDLFVKLLTRELTLESAGELGVEAGSYLDLMVQDTGPGVPPSLLDRLFEPYVSSKPRAEGLGMGLTVALGVVRGHGGAISVQSLPGKGAEFHVWLPLAVGGAEAAPCEDAGPSALCRGGRVLFVDDEEPITRVAVRLLGNLGCEMVAVSNGAEALRVLQTDLAGFDVLITDYAMPGMTGLNLAREVRKTLPGLPIVLCTGYADATTPEEARLLGIRRILRKPIRRAELVEALNEVFQGDLGP